MGRKWVSSRLSAALTGYIVGYLARLLQDMTGQRAARQRTRIALRSFYRAVREWELKAVEDDGDEDDR